jgi:hypothetical protein
MKNQDKPKMSMKKTVTKAVVKPIAKTTKRVVQPIKKVEVKTIKTVVKPKSQEPNYKGLRMGVNNDNRAAGQMFETKPTKADSASYKFGYKLGLAGKGPNPSETNTVKMGRWEGQKAKKK